MKFMTILLLSLMTISSTYSQEVPLTPVGNAEEVLIEIPKVIQNFSIVQSGEHPEFLTRRGDFQELKRKTGNGKGVKVGVVDTGLDVTHSRKGGDLELYNGSNSTTYRVRKVKDFTGSRSGWADLSSHGSHVAGHIGASANGRGIEGIASDCDLYIAKGLGDNGFGTDSQIANSINWLIEEKVDIINLSLGGGYSERIEQAVLAARRAGILVFAALGNNGNRGDGHPGNSEHSLGIAAVNYQFQLAGFSSRSPKALLSGFGVNVYSCLRNGSYGALSGTSMATPDQAGVAALIIGYLRKNNIEVENMLDYWQLVKESVNDLGQSGWDRGYGYGFLDIWKVLSFIDENVIDRSDPNQPPTDPDAPDESEANPYKDYGKIAHWNNELGEYIVLQKKGSGSSSRKPVNRIGQIITPKTTLNSKPKFTIESAKSFLESVK